MYSVGYSFYFWRLAISWRQSLGKRPWLAVSSKSAKTICFASIRQDVFGKNKTYTGKNRFVRNGYKVYALVITGFLLFLIHRTCCYGGLQKQVNDGGDVEEKAYTLFYKYNRTHYQISAGAIKLVTGSPPNRCCSMMVFTSAFFKLPYIMSSG